MNILLVFPGFIIIFVVVLLYEYRIRLMRKVPNKNRVHFYVARNKFGDLWLYLGKPVRGSTTFYYSHNKKVFCLTYDINCFGLKEEDFDFLKWEDEPVEVFLNLED